MHDYIMEFLQRVFLPVCTLVGLIVVSRMDKRLNGKRDINVVPAAVVLLCLVLVKEVDYYSDIMIDHHNMIRVIASMLGYILRVGFVYSLLCALDGSVVKKFYHYIPMVLTVALAGTMLFSDIFVWFSEDNEFYRGPLYLAIYVPVIYYLVIMLHKLFSKEYIGGRDGKIVYTFCILIPVVASVLDSNVAHDRELFYLAAMVSLAIFYLSNLIIHRKKKDTAMDAEIYQMESQLMISQIQPHFINNTLATIRALNKTDPEAAGAVIDNFSAYLRSNLSNLNKNEPIPFLDEIQHTKTYVEIEKVRFSNIDVEFDLQITDFKVPALSIQPLVENAIKHGVRARKRGLVKVKSFETDLFYAVEIADNGKGFDVGSLESMGSEHYGLKNVKKRLEVMADAEMRIYSVIDRGTVASIYIPKNK